MVLTKIKNKKASLLLEALLGVVILSVSITTVIQAMTQALRSQDYSREATIALFQLDKVVSQLRLAPEVEPVLSFPDDKYVLNIDREESNALTEIIVSLSWKKGGKNHALKASTYVLAKEK